MIAAIIEDYHLFMYLGDIKIRSNFVAIFIAGFISVSFFVNVLCVISVNGNKFSAFFSKNYIAKDYATNSLSK